MTWEPSVYPEYQIFPSFVVSTATMATPDDAEEIWDCPYIGDPLSNIGALVHGAQKGDRLRVVVKKNALMDESSVEGVVRRNSGELIVLPKIRYHFDELAKIHQQRPMNLDIEVWRNGESLGEQTATVDVRSINDCLFLVLNDDGEVEFDASWNFAAYLNENHPWVDDVLREALETGQVDAFDGYQSGEPEQVLLQIYAVWNVMQRRGIRYSDITTTANESETVLSQHVRLFDESIRAKQANCVDGSVMLGAILRKIGLQAYLVLEPAHMFLAVNLESGDEESMIGVETTMMGSEHLQGSGDLPEMSAKKAERLKNRASFRSFEAAVDAGTQELDDHSEEFFGDDPDYQLIDIAEARAEGIMPIAFEGVDD